MRSKTRAVSSLVFMRDNVSLVTDAQRSASDRGAVAVRLLPAHGRARHRAHTRRRDGRGAQPRVGNSRGGRRAAARGAGGGWRSRQDRRTRVTGVCGGAGRVRGPRRSRPARSSVKLGTLDPDSANDSLRRLRVYAGYTGWAAGQLDGELEQGAWWPLRAGRGGGPVQRRRHLVARARAPKAARTSCSPDDAAGPVAELRRARSAQAAAGRQRAMAPSPSPPVALGVHVHAGTIQPVGCAPPPSRADRRRRGFA